MARCDACKTHGQRSGKCANCGNVLYNMNVAVYFGPSKEYSTTCEFRLTDRYIILKRLTAGEIAGNAVAGGFGLVGVLVAGVSKAANDYAFGFYDLREIQQIVYPYDAPGVKGDKSIKIINKDNTDFVINFTGLFKSAVEKIVNCFRLSGVYVRDGAGVQNPVFCYKPFLTMDTISNRICASAASFVDIMPGQFVVPAITEASGVVPQSAINMPPQSPVSYSQTPQTYPQTPQAYPQTPQAYPQTPQAYPQTPQAYPQTPQAYPQNGGVAYQNNPPVQNVNVPLQNKLEETEDQKTVLYSGNCCPGCGFQNPGTSHFCSMCGKKF